MMNFMKSLTTSATGMQAQADRMRVVSENVANADTPGYRRKLLTFENTYNRADDTVQVSVDKVLLDQTALREEYDPSHPMADAEGNVQMSNVNLVTELADSREARRSYEANLNVFDQTRRMYASVLELLRR